jgi:hypothetical protein
VPGWTRALVWLALGFFAISLPSLADLISVPAWLAWLINGYNGGQAPPWRFMGATFVTLGTLLLLSWAAEKYNSPLLGYLAVAVLLICAAAGIVVAFGFVTLVGPFMLSIVARGMAAHLPALLPWVTDLESGTSATVARCLLGLAILWSACVTFRESRVSDPAQSFFSAAGWSALHAVWPFVLVTLVSLTAFVGVAMLIFALSLWFPLPWGLASWIDGHSGPLIAFGVIAVVLATFVVHYSRRRRDPAARFIGTCHAVLITIFVLEMLVLVVALIAAALKAVSHA